MLAKDFCEMTTFAKTKSTCDIVRPVGKLLIVALLCWVFFYLHWQKHHCRYCIVYARGKSFYSYGLFVCEADTS